MAGNIAQDALREVGLDLSLISNDLLHSRRRLTLVVKDAFAPFAIRGS